MIKEYAELVQEFTIPNTSDEYDIQAGVYKDDECECFILEIVDRKHGKVYTNSFNSEWCDPDKKEWIAYVVSKGMLDNVTSATYAQKQRTREAFKAFQDTFK